MHKLNFTFFEDENFLDGVEMEDDDDIQERWIAEKTKYMTPQTDEQTLQVVFVDVTREQWKELGIRESLWGQSRVVNGKIICYGSWHEESDYDQSKHFPEPFKSMTELALGLAHETCHGGYKLKGIRDLTHFHFYGLNYPASNKRYARTPTPTKAFEEFLAPDENVNFFCIRTSEITEQWKKEIRSVEKIINPNKKKEVTTKTDLLQPQNKYSWVGLNNPDSIVLHTLLGSIEGSDAWLEEINLSYHYMISEEGELTKLVNHKNAAWHSGIKHNPNERARNHYKDLNPNVLSIGIAFERKGESELTKEQVQACDALIGKLEKEFKIDFNDENIFAHQEITSYKPREVLNYRLQVLEGLEGGKLPKNKKSPAELKSEIQENQGKVLTLMSKWLKNIFNSIQDR